MRKTFIFLICLTLLAACTKKPSISIATILITSVGDTMAYDQTTLTVKAGTQVSLTFKNNANSNAMTHNWTLLTNADVVDKVGIAGIQAGPTKGYIPDMPDVIIAHTKLLGPHESDTISFIAPTPGSYPYICTYPGHYATMRGILKSTL